MYRQVIIASFHALINSIGRLAFIRKNDLQNSAGPFYFRFCLLSNNYVTVDLPSSYICQEIYKYRHTTLQLNCLNFIQIFVYKGCSRMPINRTLDVFASYSLAQRRQREMLKILTACYFLASALAVINPVGT